VGWNLGCGWMLDKLDGELKDVCGVFNSLNMNT